MPNISTITDNGDGTITASGDSEFLDWCDEFVPQYLSDPLAGMSDMERDAYLYSL